jgi:hypothetical protein
MCFPTGSAMGVLHPVVHYTPDQANQAVARRSHVDEEPLAPKQDSTFKTPIQQKGNVFIL